MDEPRRREPARRPRDLLAYHEAVCEVLSATQNHVRNLIGSDHWQTDGEHKEEILRDILRSRLPEDMRVGRGFVCMPSGLRDLQRESSGQIDVLITAKRRPFLYRQGDLVFVTAEAVEAIIEVKTELRVGTNPDLAEVLVNLAEQVEMVRRNGNERCWAGLFVYERGCIREHVLLTALRQAANCCEQRAIDCVALGPSVFVHYWPDGARDVGSPVAGPVWHSYALDRLAPSYFVSNVAMHVCPETPHPAEGLWFPIEDGKETRRTFYAPLHGDRVHAF